MTTPPWTLLAGLLTAARDRIDRRRAGRRYRLVVETAHRVLGESEFTGYLAGGEHRSYLVQRAGQRSAEATAEFESLRRAFRRRVSAAAALTVTVAAVGVVAGIEVTQSMHLPDDQRGGARGLAASAVLAVWHDAGLAGRIAVSLLTVLFLVGLGRRAAGYAMRLITEHHGYADALTQQVRPLLRLAIMDLANEQEAPVLRITSAPGLSSASDRLHRVTRPEIREIDNLMRELGASAVAISGPRGAGKSTLLHDLAERDGPPRDLVVQVEAAATYLARDFIIMLYRALCETVLTEIRRDRRWVITERPARLSRRYATSRMRRRARNHLMRLQYLQNLTEDRSLTLKLKLPDFGWKRTQQLIEQPTALPDMVRAFRRFAGDVARWWSATQRHSGGLIIMIDELDRINDGERAEAFVNEIKGIFGVPGCTYLVTISEDALALFERRMIGMRPALDSTFDEVLRLKILSLDGSVELLGRRLVGCPRPFMALCHALSGGLPRELIRTARTLVDEAGAHDGDPADHDNRLSALTQRLVAQDIRRLKDGFVPRLRNEASTSEVHQVLMDLADDDWPGTTAKHLLQRGDDLIHHPPAENPVAERICLQLGASLWYYATILETFGLTPEPARPCHPRLTAAAESLAAIRSVMPVSVELALTRLIKLRRELDLEVPMPETGMTAFT